MKVERTALIIGCGKMGCFYDSPESPEIESHAHALTKMGFQLFFHDTDSEKSTLAAKKWNGKAVSQLGTEKYDVVVVAAAAQAHYPILMRLPANCFQTLVIEKPFCESLASATEVLSRFSGRRVFVNYSRLYIPAYAQLHRRISQKEFGACLRFAGTYSRGLRNNGSHMVSLLKYLLEFDTLDFKVQRKMIEPASGFINCDVSLQSGHGTSGSLIGFDGSNYAVWEISLYFEKALVKINNAGCEISIQPLSTKNQLLAGEILKQEINYNDALLGLYDRVQKDDSEFAQMTTENALFTHRLIDAILEAHETSH